MEYQPQQQIQRLEYGTKDEVKQFFSSSFSDVYKIFLDHLQALDTTAKQKSMSIICDECGFFVVFFMCFFLRRLCFSFVLIYP